LNQEFRKQTEQQIRWLTRWFARSLKRRLSIPVESRMTSGFLSPPWTTYPPLATPSMLVPGWLGIPWREKARIEGRGLPPGTPIPLEFSTAICVTCLRQGFRLSHVAGSRTNGEFTKLGLQLTTESRSGNPNPPNRCPQIGPP
jgi:hypothetical protein